MSLLLLSSLLLLAVKACDDFGLTISIKKTEVLHQPAPATPYVEPNITVNGQKLAVTDKFVYLGSTLSRSVNIDEEVSYRIARASAAFGRLRAEYGSDED